MRCGWRWGRGRGDVEEEWMNGEWMENNIIIYIIVCHLRLEGIGWYSSPVLRLLKLDLSTPRLHHERHKVKAHHSDLSFILSKSVLYLSDYMLCVCWLYCFNTFSYFTMFLKVCVYVYHHFLCLS